MTSLILAALAFVGAHVLISSTGLRVWLVGRLGERVYTILFSVQALALIAWMGFAFRAAPRDLFLWSIPGATHLALAAMPFVLVLLIGGFTARNPTAALMTLPDAAWQPNGVLTVTRHPVMWAFGLWALLHILANGDLAGLIFFGAFAVLALTGTLAIDAKKSRTWPAEQWRSFTASTSNLPFLAIAQGRTRFDWKGTGWKPVLIAAIVDAAILLWFHPQVIGVPLMGK